MLPPLLAAVAFRSHNATHQPLIRALTLLTRSLPRRGRPAPVEEEGPLAGVLRAPGRAAGFEPDAQGRPRVNRRTSERGVLQTLRAQLRGTAGWVGGAGR